MAKAEGKQRLSLVKGADHGGMQKGVPGNKDLSAYGVKPGNAGPAPGDSGMEDVPDFSNYSREMLLSEISGISQQIVIASMGRTGVRKGGTLECIHETLAETEAWPVEQAHFGPFYSAAVAAKERAVAKIKELEANFGSASTTAETSAVPDFSGVDVTPNADALSQLAGMVEKLRQLQRDADDTAQAAKEAADALADYQMRVLPEVMEQAGVTEFKLADRSVLKVKDDLKASITQANQGDAFEWLREHGHGEVIKTFLEVDVRALDDKQRSALLIAIEDFEASYEAKESVHNATLKSLCKELLEKGVELPASFNIFQFKKAELKEPKGK